MEELYGINISGKDYHFNASSSNVDAFKDNSESDLNVTDESGNVIVRFENGHIKTKEFDSRKCQSVGNIPITEYFINLQGKKILLYGDSISSTDYSFYKDELEKITGANVNNAGHSGASTASLASISTLNSAVSWNPDVVFILVGGNDNGEEGSVGTFGSFGATLSNEPVVDIPDITSEYKGTKWIEAVAYIANYLSYKIGGFRHAAYNSGYCTDVGMQLNNETDVETLRKPIVVLCTTLPQQRYNSNSPWSSLINSKRKADACREISQLLNIPLLDFSKAGFNLINEAYWPGVTDKIHNKGTYMMDGLHPNKYGYKRMARIAYDFIRPYFIK